VTLADNGIKGAWQLAACVPRQAAVWKQVSPGGGHMPPSAKRL